MGRRGMTRQTHVSHVCVMRALCGVKGSAADPPTVTTQSADSAACPVMVSVWNTWQQGHFPKKRNVPDTQDNTHTSLLSFHLITKIYLSLIYSNLPLAGCMFHGKEYPDGTEFADDNDACGVCYCYGGDVVCSRLPCYGDCSHPYKPPGQCCGECERT